MWSHTPARAPPGAGGTRLRLQGRLTERGRDVLDGTDTKPSSAHGCQLLRAPPAPRGQRGTPLLPPPTHPSPAARPCQQSPKQAHPPNTYRLPSTKKAFCFLPPCPFFTPDFLPNQNSFSPLEKQSSITPGPPAALSQPERPRKHKGAWLGGGRGSRALPLP